MSGLKELKKEINEFMESTFLKKTRTPDEHIQGYRTRYVFYSNNNNVNLRNILFDLNCHMVTIYHNDRKTQKSRQFSACLHEFLQMFNFNGCGEFDYLFDKFHAMKETGSDPDSKAYDMVSLI